MELSYTSRDGEEGYPGTLKVKAVYTVTRENALRLEFTATTDKDTVVNLTHHSYWNLASQGDILGHIVYINANQFTPVDETLIPTGELRPVDGTPFDFRRPTAIGARIGQADEQLKFGNGYDHNWVIDKPMAQLGRVAMVAEPTTGRVMEVWSTEPGLQFYTGNFLDGSITGKNGRVYQFRNALVMEPQHYPDSPNQPNFPSTVLKPGLVYSQHDQLPVQCGGALNCSEGRRITVGEFPRVAASRFFAVFGGIESHFAQRCGQCALLQSQRDWII